MKIDIVEGEHRLNDHDEFEGLARGLRAQGVSEGLISLLAPIVRRMDLRVSIARGPVGPELTLYANDEPIAFLKILEDLLPDHDLNALKSIVQAYMQGWKKPPPPVAS